MRRTQIDFFFTRRQLAEVLVEVCRKHDAMLVALLRDPDERGLVDVAPDDIAAYLEQHHVPSIYVTLGPGQQPGDEGFEFLQRHPSIVVSFSAEDEAKREVYPSMANADPEGPSGPLLGTFKEAV